MRERACMSIFVLFSVSDSTYSFHFVAMGYWQKSVRVCIYLCDFEFIAEEQTEEEVYISIRRLFCECNFHVHTLQIECHSKVLNYAHTF